LVFLASHEESQLSHSESPATWLGFSLWDLTATSPVAVLLLKLLLASLALLLKALNNVNRAANREINSQIFT
jgi:hypothetical protein